MGISSLIAKAAKDYQKARTQAFANNPIRNIFVKQIPDTLKNNVNLNGYIIKGSIGQGNFAKVPWIAIMDPQLTDTTRAGIYIVFLFSADGKKVYLSFDQGISHLRENLKLRDSDIVKLSQEIANRYPLEDEVLKEIKLRANTDLAKGYEKTNIYSYEYIVDQMPADEIIFQNIESLLLQYKKIKGDYLKFGNIDNFYASFKDQAKQIPNKVKPMGVKGWNKILYGPPGTGKTYSINKYKQELLAGQTATNLIKFDNLTWRDAILVALKQAGYPSLKVKDIANLQFLKDYANTKSSKNPFQTISTTIITHADANSTTVAARNGLDLFSKDINEKWCLTETGKNAADEVENSLLEEKRQDNFFFKLVTFHQSYSYEDFIEGISAETEDGKISYQIKDGVFKKFCNDAKRYPDKNFLFVIDEINRGNISKIFGELITLIEPSKRIGSEEELSTVLPYSGDLFGVPKNVYILGTMNTADRSIAMMDTALRRRFEFIEKMPDDNVISENIGLIQDIDVAKLLRIMNRRIEFLYDREHTLGHAFFLNVRSISDLKAVFEYKIIPLLQEYFYEDYEKIQAILNDTEQIYVVKSDDNVGLFSRKFDDLLNQGDESAYSLVSDVSEEEFIRFVKNIPVSR